jgi:NO-binding membrane sensor protein with MHYT domain
MNPLDHLKFIDSGYDRDVALDVSYHMPLVALSVLLAVLASYVALEVANKLSQAEAFPRRNLWVIGGALPMGLGIWGMHFVGMLAFELPVAIHFDMTTTMISIVPAILASYLAINLIGRKQAGVFHILGGGVLIGAGIGAMHYIGMMAMRLAADMYYRLDLFLLSVVAAVSLAILALVTSRKFRNSEADQKLSHVVIPSVVMGGAISAMHYIAETSTVYMPGTHGHMAMSGATTEELIMFTSLVSVVLGLCVVVVAELKLPESHQQSTASD